MGTRPVYSSPAPEPKISCGCQPFTSGKFQGRSQAQCFGNHPSVPDSLWPLEITKTSFSSLAVASFLPTAQYSIHTFCCFTWAYLIDWPQTLHVSKDDLELLIFLPPSSSCWSYMHVPPDQLYVEYQGLKAACILARHSTNYATSLVFITHQDR